ncbi:hypothetical protein AVEN_170543-1 [Araneus ventricosus]|uniref:Uncharacterized protein n=1 Tax=Araneus ventricosus TaxID=182803 RepID=A0A4Y2BZX0_ARAVE|nr:hypothetical protein AVEN_170543-1 [Araneus ventricosus]
MIGRSKEVDWTNTSVQFLRAVVDCVCDIRLRMRLGRYSTTSCSAGQITTAINSLRRMWNAETWTLGTGLFYLFALEKLSIEKEFFFPLPHFLGAQIVFCLRGPTCHRASWQPRQSATAIKTTQKGQKLTLEC